jgi:hypothetical protein
MGTEEMRGENGWYDMKMSDFDPLPYYPTYVEHDVLVTCGLCPPVLSERG